MKCQQRAETSTYNFNSAIRPDTSSLQSMFVGGSLAHIPYVPMQQKRRKSDNNSELWVYNSAQSVVADAKKRDLRAANGRTPKHCWGIDSAWSTYAYAIIFGGLRPNGTITFLCRLKFNRLWFRVVQGPGVQCVVVESITFGACKMSRVLLLATIAAVAEGYSSGITTCSDSATGERWQ